MKMYTHDKGEYFENDFFYVFFGNKNFSQSLTFYDTHRLIFGRQTHGDTLTNVDFLNHSYSTILTSSSDGLYTSQANTKLSIYTADCIPCFIFNNNKVFSLHLGWRGLQTGLLEKALSLCQTTHTCYVFIGPHIKKHSFEVGPEVVEGFQQNLNETSWFSESDNNKFHISLEDVIRLKIQQNLGQSQQQHLITSSIDTVSHTNYNSYRRDRQTPERNISFAFRKSKV